MKRPKGVDILIPVFSNSTTTAGMRVARMEIRVPAETFLYFAKDYAASKAGGLYYGY